MTRPHESGTSFDLLDTQCGTSPRFPFYDPLPRSVTVIGICSSTIHSLALR
ncbi:hypothetical protein [Roseiflexus castenholzii]|uniref:hypothetical protein n=1 Tax=Roseiflexus castenholzii TaxID=120962 RepID=UPI0023558C30